MMPKFSNRTGAIPALTGLRFVAALMVFFSHYPISGLGEVPERIMASGYSGVTFFFVLSGFIIAYNYIEQFETNPLRSTPKYLWARFSRVYPLYILSMAFVWLQKDANTPIAIYIFAAQAWHSDTSIIAGLNSPAWSVSVEFFLYLCFPLLIPAFSSLGILRPGFKMFAAALIVIISQLSLAAYFGTPPHDSLTLGDPNSAHRMLYNFPLPRIFDFTLGILTAAYYLRREENRTNSKQWGYASYGIAAAIILFMASKLNYLSSFSWDASYAWLFALLILSIAESQQSVLSMFLSTKKAVLLGEASFAFYLIHVIALPLFDLSTQRSFAAAIAFEFMFLGLVITMSIGLHLSVEKPCRRWLIGLVHSREKGGAHGGSINTQPSPAYRAHPPD
jgi:peptidoglycan/LPS O-acetylase OafA/YrhL